MCGIIGYVGDRACTQLLLDGLGRLEYRGYDSAGVALVHEGALLTRRAEGKLSNLRERVYRDPIDGKTGIGHTRWATHGKPSEENAHPHRSGTVAVVHNGIIENHLALRDELEADGYVFDSETDTEIVAHLVHRERMTGKDLAGAVRHATLRLRGAYSLVVIDASEPQTLVGAKEASPLVLGLGDGENFVASDIPAVLEHTRDFVFLEDGTMAVVHADRAEVLRVSDGEVLPLVSRHISWSPAMAEKGGYKHFMLKEIHEQPQAIANTLSGRISLERAAIEIPEIPLTRADLAGLTRVYIVACGTAWHAGLVARYLFEDLAGLSPHVELASELRYRNAPMDEHTLVLAISQSGETADTLAAFKDAKAQGARCIAICNVLESSIPREALGTLYTHAGPEIGVASTKAFTTQIAAAHLLALHFGQLLGRLDPARMASELDGLVKVAGAMERMLEDESAPYLDIARAWHDKRSMLYLGRGNNYPMALEGALKLKEISYIHAEGFAAGEMKHGPIALIDEDVPTVVIAPRDRHYPKVASNLSEVKARGGPVLAIATEGDHHLASIADFVITIPDVPEHVLPLVTAVPMQLLAYTMADFKGTDVDQPRNLAKSVTVE